MGVRILATETDDVPEIDEARLSYNVDCSTSTLSDTVFLRPAGLGQCKLLKPQITLQSSEHGLSLEA